jgi:hypothetical protein
MYLEVDIKVFTIPLLPEISLSIGGEFIKTSASLADADQTKNAVSVASATLHQL